MTGLHKHLNPDDLLHVAVYACLTTTFYSAARLGEFLPKTLDCFKPETHVKPSDVHTDTDRQGLESTVFHIPRTKMSTTGEEVSWSRQDGVTDPEAALEAHMRVNNPPETGPLFAYRYTYLTKGKKIPKTMYRALTRNKFLEVINELARVAGMEALKGHSIRIGATLEYLLRGTPFDVVKVKGRWASDAFLVYLRKHAQILAPYMQAHSAQNEEFIRIVIPGIQRQQS
ncbi:hypothetical protein FA15DRAFT_720654 [Coprinopsis marcescibilis]|uniref:Tyr recombinase domain-containing protein n=1 Tax=Coprinopsis marcescibilis TaxID=230819 RepID=A0A5C3KJL9_COPMA|nr:hypothetical protein FA15DRAFT_720654 [Coprinopsis marcescibilis]